MRSLPFVFSLLDSPFLISDSSSQKSSPVCFAGEAEVIEKTMIIVSLPMKFVVYGPRPVKCNLTSVGPIELCLHMSLDWFLVDCLVLLPELRSVTSC